MRDTVRLIMALTYIISASKALESISIVNGCYRDVECDRGEYCDIDRKGCITIPKCAMWEARVDGWDYGDCVKCKYDKECTWTLPTSGKPNDHKYCWRGDGVCRQKPPFTMSTFAWERSYNSKVGYIDTLVPSNKFVQGDTMCFVVTTPYPPSYAKYLRVSLDRVETCALRQKDHEAMIRLEEAQRVERHHGVSGVHRYHGIIPYDPEQHETTGCNTKDNYNRIDRFILESPGNFLNSVGDNAPKNSTFVIVDSSSGATALCLRAKAISPGTIPVYIQAEVSVKPQAHAIETLLESPVREDKLYEDIIGMLVSYGIHIPSTSLETRVIDKNIFPNGKPLGDIHEQYRTIVIHGTREEEAYVYCPEGYEWNGNYGYCETNDWDNDLYFWSLVLSGIFLVIAFTVALMTWSPGPGVTVI